MGATGRESRGTEVVRVGTLKVFDPSEETRFGPLSQSFGEAWRSTPIGPMPPPSERPLLPRSGREFLRGGRPGGCGDPRDLGDRGAEPDQ
jgi:hypothetical protein